MDKTMNECVEEISDIWIKKRNFKYIINIMGDGKDDRGRSKRAWESIFNQDKLFEVPLAKKD
jgi:hypothetical protein